MSNQSQNHGFTYENLIRELIFNLNSESNNTDKYDISSSNNIYNPNENISIKTTGNYTICCGDILRFFTYDFSKRNTIICVKYLQIHDKKHVECVYEIDYNSEMHRYLFGSITYQELEEYVLKLKKIPKNIKGNEAKEIFDYLKEKVRLQALHNMNIMINPKVDSSQTRVQCSILNFKDNLNGFITYNSLRDCNQSNIIRLKEIPKIINSPKRRRNGFTKDELLGICRNNKNMCSGYSNKKKDELLELLQKLNLMD